MNKAEKRNIREEYALKKIGEPIILDQKLLRKQINTMSALTRLVNDEIGDYLVGVEQVLETFEWLPKGEYVITVKIV
jgi:hypothetical protein